MASKREIIERGARRLHYYDKERAEGLKVGALVVGFLGWDDMTPVQREYYIEAARLVWDAFAESIHELGAIR